MINRFKLFQNIGRFNSDAGGASHELSKLTLIYADNAQGKTTLTAILRSLATGDPNPITERRRLGSQHAPKAVLTWQDELSDVIFQSGTWNQTFENLKVFDDHFVDENVYSGLDVASSHRQNLHELILGDRGVALNRTLGAYVSRVVEHNTAIAAKSSDIPDQERYGLTVEAFCALTEVPDLDEKIATAERAMKAAQDQELVTAKPILSTLALPVFDIAAIRETLSKDLADLDKTAEAQVQAHIHNLGEDGESWVADGVQKAAKRGDKLCPFCNQDMQGVALIAHYQAYFSQEYSRLKQAVSELIDDIELNHADGKQVEFERVVSVLMQTMHFWSSYCDVPSVEVDSADVVDSWNAALTAVDGQLQAKRGAPLDVQSLQESTTIAIDEYNRHRQAIASINQTLQETNEAIKLVKHQAQAANTTEVTRKLNVLKATKCRFRQDIAPLCDDYLEELADKAKTESARDEARKELDEYRTNIFPKLQDGVNDYLDRMNATFSIGELTSTNIGGGSGSTCTYNLVINDMPVAVRSDTEAPGEPSFRNSLSGGDRSTLALALFFSSLDRNSKLAETVVVIDDPLSSLDDHRSLVTVQKVRKLSRKANQTIILSHDKGFLCGILSGLNSDEPATTLEIASDGNESTIRHWDASQDSITEHDQRFCLLQGFAVNQSGATKEIAPAIRLYLEGYFRAVCPGQYSPGKLLGQFAQECKHRLGTANEIISKGTITELEDILEYANRFHHDTNPAWQSESINPTELLGFVKRTLSLAGPPSVL